MKRKSGYRKARGKQPKPYWRWVPDKSGGGRWYHPLVKTGLAVGLAMVAPSIIRSVLPLDRIGNFVSNVVGDFLHYISDAWGE